MNPDEQAALNDLKAKVDALVTEVAAVKTLAGSGVTTLNGLAAKLATLEAQIAASGSVTDPKVLAALSALSAETATATADLTTSATSLGVAVTADAGA